MSRVCWVVHFASLECFSCGKRKRNKKKTPEFHKRGRIKPANSLGRICRATSSRFCPFFQLQLQRKAWYFQPCCPKSLGAGCQSWCHIIQCMLHWSKSDTWARFLLSYGPFNPLDLCTKNRKLWWATPDPSWQHFCKNCKDSVTESIRTICCTLVAH